MNKISKTEESACQRDNFRQLEISSAAKLYVLSVTCILFVTAVLKIISVWQSRGTDTRMDPVLIFMRADILLVAVAALEIFCGTFLCFVKNQRKQLLLILWLSSLFLLYRLGLFAVGYSGPCACLGKPQSWQDFHFFASLNSIMKIVLAYMAIPSFLFLKLISKAENKL